MIELLNLLVGLWLSALPIAVLLLLSRRRDRRSAATPVLAGAASHHRALATKGSPAMSPAVTAGLLAAGASPPPQELTVVIVAGHILVDPQQREHYLAHCVGVVEQARRAPGCLDFSLSADLLDPGRVNVLERWASQADVEAFRGSGPSDEQGAAMLGASVAEYDVAAVRALT